MANENKKKIQIKREILMNNFPNEIPDIREFYPHAQYIDSMHESHRHQKDGNIKCAERSAKNWIIQTTLVVRMNPEKY